MVHWFHSGLTPRVAGASTAHGGRSLTLAEVVADQCDNCVQGLALVGPVGLEHDATAFAGGEHHDSHDALRVYLAAIASEGNLALIVARKLGELGRRPGVKAQLVDDLNFLLPHRSDRRRYAEPRRSHR